MKKEIQDALERAYGTQLGLADKSVYARVAALGETYVTKEEEIPVFVQRAGDILKSFQGADDRGRALTQANAKVAELEAKVKELSKNPDTDNGGEGDDSKPDMQKLISDAVSAAVKPLAEQIEGMKSANEAATRLADAKSRFYAGDWAKKYKGQADNAWERVANEDSIGGNKMSADELVAKATDYFNTYTGRIGVDTTKPFKADPPSDEKGVVDWSAEKKRLQDTGRLPKQS